MTKYIAMTMTDITVRRLSGALGAEVHGVRPADLDDDGFAEITSLWHEHLVLFFPAQDLSPDEHVALGRRFGEPEIHPFIPKLSPGHPEVVVLEGDARADVFHTDVTFSATPPMASILQARLVPERGGDTIFTNQYLAYEQLSAPLRELLDGLTAVHTATAFGHPEIRTEHPVVREHPETGRRSLFVNRQFTSHIPQLRRPESDALLAYLFAWSEEPSLQCRYHWAVGTVGIWDNRCTQHYAVNDYPPGLGRRMERVTVLGDAPKGSPSRWEAYAPEGFSAATAVYAAIEPGVVQAVPIDEQQNSV
jgi:taurine dioxygenase